MRNCDGFCSVCGSPLNRSQRDEAGFWKSCPGCSRRNRRVHIYHRFPDAFGVSVERVSGSDPEGAQSYCVGCRSSGGPRPRDPRRCGEIVPVRRRGRRSKK